MSYRCTHCNTTGGCSCHARRVYDSPVISVDHTSCSSGACGIPIVSLRNAGAISSYARSIRARDSGYPKAPNCRPEKMKKKIYKKVRTDCCNTCGCNNGTCGCNKAVFKQPVCEEKKEVCKPKLSYEDLCNRKQAISEARGIQYSYSTCNISGEVPEVIREIPNADIYIVNYQFINLCIDEILDCLDTTNLGPTTVGLVKWYVARYYEYYNKIDKVGAIDVTKVISLDVSLMIDPALVGKTKAVLWALDARLSGEVYQNEQ